ncbi:hypothetical protein [Fredinandcohnia sp. 179-A 10B2 NHS]|uniref:hypothetical protein n=1 Tax=Fredinandcohnia sp. 179-A 10B2 NHS TaxID=3235176 RepID=UPI0039A1AFB2
MKLIIITYVKVIKDFREVIYLQVNYTPSVHREVKLKKQRTVRTVLNISGVLIFLGLALSIFTMPLTLNENKEIYFNHDYKLKPSYLKEFIVFIVGSAIVYFSLVNLFFLERIGKRIVYTALGFLLVGTVYMIVTLI